MSPFGRAPIAAAAGSPFLNRRIVGIDWTPYAAIDGQKNGSPNPIP